MRKKLGSKLNSFEEIKFPFLQAYPLLQYNLSKLLFNYFSISKIIFIFINTFLQKYILIFSENINFPLNDNN